MKLAQFFTTLLFALALVPGGAHVLELANKMRLDQDQYMTVQQIYRGWDSLGIVLMAALLAGLVLSFLSRRQKLAFSLALAAFLLLGASTAIFFIWTFPMNTATANWTLAPENWAALRRQWEYSHALGATAAFAALCCATGSCLAWKK